MSRLVSWMNRTLFRDYPSSWDDIVFSERMCGGSKISGGIVYEAVYVLWRLRLQLSSSHDTLTPLPAPLVQFSAKRGEPVRGVDA